MRVSILAIALVALALPAGATSQYYEAPQNRLKVVPLNATDFEVIEEYGEGARGIWCAAASYVDSHISRARTGDLYVKTPRGPSLSVAGRSSVIFTISPDQLDAKPFRSYSVGVRRAGQSLSVQHAYQFCKDYIIEPGDVLYRLGQGHS